MNENLRRKLMEIFLTFCIATTGTVFVCAVYVGVFWRDNLLSQDILWQILLLCFVCSLCNFIPPCPETSRKRGILNTVVRYLYINLVVLGGGHLFHWLDITNIFMLAVTMLDILLIYLGVSAVMWMLQKRDSDRLNQRLQEYQQTGNRTLS